MCKLVIIGASVSVNVYVLGGGLSVGEHFFWCKHYVVLLLILLMCSC